jgi:hypothetical protein
MWAPRLTAVIHFVSRSRYLTREWRSKNLLTGFGEVRCHWYQKKIFWLSLRRVFLLFVIRRTRKQLSLQTSDSGHKLIWEAPDDLRSRGNLNKGTALGVIRTVFRLDLHAYISALKGDPSFCHCIISAICKVLLDRDPDAASGHSVFRRRYDGSSTCSAYFQAQFVILESWCYSNSRSKWIASWSLLK